ncbi:MAG: hypothetical protein NZO16_02660 [Deltaproteobacteria bacterium]|nr:hypothetical protein [Deltaproteobacteria bacterium]
MNKFYANLILAGCSADADFIDALGQKMPLNICIISDINRSENFKTYSKEINMTLLQVIEGGVEPCLSFVRGWKRTTVLTACFFFRNLEHNLMRQLLNVSNFGIFDSEICPVEAFELFDISWLRGRVYRQVLEKTIGFGSRGEIVTCSVDFRKRSSLLNLGWLVHEFFLPVSLEAKTSCEWILRGRDAKLFVSNSPNESISFSNIDRPVDVIKVVKRRGIIESSLIGETVDPDPPFSDQLLAVIKYPSFFLGYREALNLVNYLISSYAEPAQA